jgi:hypothetical protein
MQATNHPEAFGVFKPVGYIVASFRTEDDLSRASHQLQDAGFGPDEQVRYSADEMVHQANADIEQAGMLASVGQELNLVKAHRELAEQGQCFLIVHAPTEKQTQRVADVMRATGATRAQKYGRLMIEELVDVGSTLQQVSESPGRGLDPQTTSGHEGDKEPGAR